MEILNTNFEEHLGLILESIESAEFLAIDTEFTGLFHNTEEAFDESDSLDDRYLKLRKSCENFFMCQLGISVFIKDFQSNSYKIRTFTIYTIPYSRDRYLSISSSSMRFLVEHNFDTNKLFKYGIPCVRLAQATTVPAESKDHLWKLGEHSLDLSNQYVTDIISFINSKFEISKDFEFSNHYQKYLIIGPCGAVKHFKNLNYVIVDTAYRSFVRISKIEGKEPVFCPPQIAAVQTESEQIFHELGASIIFSAILNERKPIIVHNGLFDIGFLYTHFIDTLPETLNEFKNDIKILFPEIFDTKTIAKCMEYSQLKRLNLEGLHATCSKVLGVEDLVRYYLDDQFINLLSEKLHDAGYDSFVTGIVFLYLREFLKKNQGLEDVWEGVKRYSNCICLNKMAKMYLNLNTSGKSSGGSTRGDKIIKFELVQEMSLNSLADYFSKYGDIYIKKLENRKFFVKYESIYPGYSIPAIIEALKQFDKFEFL